MDNLMKTSFGIFSGEWSWRSFTAGEHAGKTIVMAAAAKDDILPGKFHHLVTIDWRDFDSRPEGWGRKDAEALAGHICAAVNQFEDSL